MSTSPNERWHLVSDANFCSISRGIGKPNIMDKWDPTPEDRAIRNLIVSGVNLYLESLTKRTSP